MKSVPVWWVLMPRLHAIGCCRSCKAAPAGLLEFIVLSSGEAERGLNSIVRGIRLNNAAMPLGPALASHLHLKQDCVANAGAAQIWHAAAEQAPPILAATHGMTCRSSLSESSLAALSSDQIPSCTCSCAASRQDAQGRWSGHGD